MVAIFRAGPAIACAVVLTACQSAPPSADTAPPTGMTPPSAGVTPPTGAAGVAPAAGCPASPYGARVDAPGGAKTVALTFDDGPGKSTAAIIAILERYRVPATFFNIGVNMAARPSLVRAEVKGGYAAGNHTWNHPDLDDLTAARQAAELDEASAEQRSITGTVPCAFRPPYGDYNSTTLRLAQQRRMGVWLWSADTEDWKADGSGSPYWVHRITRLAEQEGGVLRHPIVLMHNELIGNPATVSALPVIIQFFRARGYRFVTL